MIKNFFKHLHTVNKHRWEVFKLSIKVGIPFRGLVHDLSKYSYEEFSESVKYYADGKYSPLLKCKKETGYSKAWLHHKGRNKHHFEYWEDINETERYGVFIPYKYIVECICDRLAAGKVYLGKNFNNKEPLEYWNNNKKKGLIKIHPGIIEFIETVLTKISVDGIDASLNSKYLKKTYYEIRKKYQ